MPSTAEGRNRIGGRRSHSSLRAAFGDPHHTDTHWVDLFPGGPSYEQHRQQGRRDEHPEKSRVEVRIDVASVNTGNAERDQHLRTADFFDTDTHPEMTFRSTSVRMAGKGQLIASGPLTIKGISREIDLPLSLLGTKAIPAQMQPMLGGAKQVASFRAGTTIDRGDFEVGTGSWAATLVVGSQVDIDILLEVHNR